MRLRVGSVLVAVVAALGWMLAGPAQLGGGATYVTTHGNSMAPRFHTGDLALLRPADHYGVGDIAAYHSHQLKTVVMHRIVAVEGDTFTFKGDHNSWLDPEHPSTSDVIGKLVAQVPQGGIWLGRVKSPVGLGLVAFALLAGGGGAVQTRRRRRGSRATSSRNVARPGHPRGTTLATAPPWLRRSAATTAGLGILGLALAAVAWTGPLTEKSTGKATGSTPGSGSMTFSYTASVPRSPAYDGTTVTSPDPVFRRLANTVDVHFAYQGTPGTVTVNAVLSTASGWHSRVPLAAPATFTTTGYDGTVRLDLLALDARAQAAAAVTGLPASQLTVDVIPQVDTADGARFAPTLPLRVSPLVLTLAGDAKALVVKSPTTVTRVTTAPRTVGALGRHLTVAQARTLSTILLLAGLLGAVLLALIGRRSGPTSEGAGIRRRYGALLLPVHPMPTPPGRPLVDVTTFATLARLAERYGLLVLHWSRSGVETFVVQDEGTTYRYRTSAGDDPDPVVAEGDDLMAQAMALLNVATGPRSGEPASRTDVTDVTDLMSPAVPGPVTGQAADDRAGFDDQSVAPAAEPSP